MDFHGLTRRQLQALCKLNKIPANMTNVAMADALSALDNVEGIEELMQPLSPEKGETGSPEVPRTATRTSTRARKPPVNVGIGSQSRTRTSRKLVDDDMVGDVVNTPAVASSRKRVPAAVSRRKAEVPFVHKVYSTRRSVRLVEKQLSELCLGESKTRTQTQPIKIDIELSSEMTESGVQGDNLAKTTLKNVIDDEVNSGEVSGQVVETIGTAVVGQGNEVHVAAAPEIVEEVISGACADADAEEADVEEVVESVPVKHVESQTDREGVSDLGVKEEVAMELAVHPEKDISTGVEFDSVAVVDESSFKESADHEKVEKSINEVTGMETQADKHDPDAPAAYEYGNSNYLEQKAELLVAETKTEISSAMEEEIVEVTASQIPKQNVPNEDYFEDLTNDFNGQEHIENLERCEDTEEVLNSGEPKLVTFEKKLDAPSPAWEQTTGLIKGSAPETENVDKENIVKDSLVRAECFKAPKKPLEDLSIRELRKMLKVMRVSSTGNKEKEEDAKKHPHQDTPRPPTRQALQTLPGNTNV